MTMQQFNFNTAPVDFVGAYGQGAAIADARDQQQQMEGLKAQVQGFIDNGQPEQARELLEMSGISPMDLGISIGSLLGGDQSTFQPVQQNASPIAGMPQQSQVGLDIGGQVLTAPPPIQSVLGGL